MLNLKKTINEAVAVLQRGGVVVFPTETSYGLAAAATNRAAVKRLMLIKGRSLKKTLPLIVSDTQMARRYVVISGLARQIVSQFWPGPLTLVLPIQPTAAKKLSPFCQRRGQVAIRVSAHPVAAALARQLGQPIVATSANLSGQPACYSTRTFRRQFFGQRFQPDYFLDIGRLTRRLPSTMARIKNEKIEILRCGSIKLTKYANFR